MCVWTRGKQLIVNQIEERLEEKMLLDEMREQEGQQMLENLERMQIEELEVLDVNSVCLCVSVCVCLCVCVCVCMLTG